MSTIGYGDLTPKNQVGYAIVILLIMAVVSVFPFMISGIMDALAQAKGNHCFGYQRVLGSTVAVVVTRVLI